MDTAAGRTPTFNPETLAQALEKAKERKIFTKVERLQSNVFRVVLNHGRGRAVVLGAQAFGILGLDQTKILVSEGMTVDDVTEALIARYKN